MTESNVSKRVPLQHFNLDTMSGVHPGTRTPVYRKLLLSVGIDAPPDWHTLSWYADPPSLALATPPHAPIAAWSLPEHPAEFTPALATTLHGVNRQAHACYACSLWTGLSIQDADGVPLGVCAWQAGLAGAAQPARRLLDVQSAVSLACDHFVRREVDTEPAAQSPDATSSHAAPPAVPALRVPKAAELDPDRLPFWTRLRHRLAARFNPKPRAVPTWEERLVERSGVGAGTEPCFVCQGRLANLGALTVASDHGDKQTFSVWRCRICHTLYLNDWTDRWERLESLETEERYYRVAPAEAYDVLRIIHTTPNGDHPARREERAPQRAAIMAMLDAKTPLSHQIRQGR